jgi:hypothetical protein
VSQKKQIKDVAINIRVSPEVKAIAQAEAKAARRSITSWIETLILAAPTKRRLKEFTAAKKKWDLEHHAANAATRKEWARIAAAREAEATATADAAGFQARLAAEKSKSKGFWPKK